MSDYPPPPPPPPSQPGGYGGPPGSGSSSGPSGPRAGFWIRFGAAIIDSILIGVVTGILRIAVGQIISTLIGLVLNFAYFGFFEGGPAGQTPGKKVCGIRVVRAADGGPLGWSTALFRHLCSYVSAVACLIGYLWMLWDPEKQTWHDKCSGTLEVPETAWPAPPDSFGKPPAS
jgi:uncharacterized RDD family membrane protein YckC